MRSVLRPIAPEADIDDVREDETIQEALDLDSIDFLQFVTGLAEATGFEIPERDYSQLSTVDGCVAYLTSPH
jgi:acyl carrier protein